LSRQGHNIGRKFIGENNKSRQGRYKVEHPGSKDMTQSDISH